MPALDFITAEGNEIRRYVNHFFLDKKKMLIYGAGRGHLRTEEIAAFPAFLSWPPLSSNLIFPFASSSPRLCSSLSFFFPKLRLQVASRKMFIFLRSVHRRLLVRTQRSTRRTSEHPGPSAWGKAAERDHPESTGSLTALA